MTSFKRSLPEGLQSKIKKEVVKTKVLKDAKKKRVVKGYNTEVIFSRVMCMYSADEIKINDLFLYEVAFLQTALFKDTRKRTYPTSKAGLKSALKAEVSVRNVIPEATLNQIVVK